jgi:hypothetical protein
MPVLRRCAANTEWPSVQGDALTAFQRFAEFRHTAVDCQPSIPDPLFDLAAGSITGGGQNLLDAISQDRLCQPALADAS